MQTTIESSLPHASAIAHMPPATQMWIYQRDDQLQQALAELARRDAAAAVHAVIGPNNSKASSAKLRTAIRAMAALRAPTLEQWGGSRNGRNRYLRAQIKYEIEKAENGEWMGLRKPPSEWLVGQVLDSIENQN